MTELRLESCLVQLEPGRSAEGGRPAAGPAYSAALYPGFEPPTGVTLYDTFSQAAARFGDCPCLGQKAGGRYEYLRYREVQEQAAAVASAMVQLGLRPHDRAAVFGANCPQWMITAQACNRQTVYCVPLADSLNDSMVDYVIRHSEARIVFAAAAKLALLARVLSKGPVGVKAVVYWGRLDGASLEPALKELQGLGVPTFGFAEFLQLGRQHPTPPAPPASEYICTIMYTSGTTGNLKGALLTHRAIASYVSSLSHWLDTAGIRIGPGDTYLSFLPLAHIYDRCKEEAFLHLGASIAYWSGDIQQLPADIQASRPTLLCTVPRVLERFYSSFMAQLSQAGAEREALFRRAAAVKLAALKAGAPWDKAAPQLDKLLFKGISQRMFGGRVRLITTGGAPLVPHLEEFMRVVSCACFLQGYGLTEGGPAFLTHPSQPGHMYTVGAPMPGLQVRLEAVPEMGCDPQGDPPRGEVLLRGPTLFSGYRRDEAETWKAVDPEGWLHTGDIGELSPNGALRIIDRRKNIFKLSQGEFVSVEKVEAALLQSPLLEQAWVHGSWFESCLVALLVPARAPMEAWAWQHGLQGTFEELCCREEVKRLLLLEVGRVSKRGGLKGFELPRALHLEPHPFSTEQGLLTPTFKLRRQELLKRYRAQVDAMYDTIKSPAESLMVAAGAGVQLQAGTVTGAGNSSLDGGRPSRARALRQPCHSRGLEGAGAGSCGAAWNSIAAAGGSTERPADQAPAVVEGKQPRARL